jgi:hypothetical protein
VSSYLIKDGRGTGYLAQVTANNRLATESIVITGEIWYEDATKAKKIVQLALLYTGVLPTTETWTVYDTDGATPLVTLTDSVTYSGVFEINRTRTGV